MNRETPENPGDSTGTTKRLASCLAFLSAKSPDLALLVERWDALPDGLKAAILALANVAGTGAQPRPPAST